jgi:hypothetical protein
MDDLIETLECFDGSENKNGILSGFQCSTIKDVGVLFWLNSQSDSNDDLILSVSTSRIADTNE